MYSTFEHLLQIKGITPYQVYKDTGIPQSTLSDWKTKERTPTAEKLLTIAEYFGVSVDYLMGKEKPVTDDDELNKYLDELRTRPEMRMLFSVSEGCTKEEVEQAVKIIEALRK